MEGGFLPERGFLVRIKHYETQSVRSHVQVFLCSRTEYNLECCNKCIGMNRGNPFTGRLLPFSGSHWQARWIVSGGPLSVVHA